MSKKTRRHFSTEDKVTALRRHLIDKVPVSDPCEELGIQPSVFYEWQRVLFARAARLGVEAPALPCRRKPLELRVRRGRYGPSGIACFSVRASSPV